MHCYGFYLGTYFHDPVLVTLWPRSGHNFEQHYNNLSSVNYLIYPKMSKSVMYLIHWRVQGIPNANWHTFMVWIKERFLCHVYYIQIDMWTILAIDSKCNCRWFSVYKYENPSSATFNNCAWIIFSQNTSNLAHTFMVWIKEMFLCHVYYIQMDMWT
jgi:hypothetical protein